MAALSAAEGALAVLLGWVIARSGFARHASLSGRVQAGDIFVLAGTGVCLTIFVAVLAWWQWRLSGRARLRLLLVIYVSLAVAFCSFCWYDVSVRVAELRRGTEAAAPLAELREQTAAVLLCIGALMAGLAGVTAVLWVERRGQRPTS